jgi:TM2 domain-containing membrane protein YozV
MGRTEFVNAAEARSLNRIFVYCKWLLIVFAILVAIKAIVDFVADQSWLAKAVETKGVVLRTEDRSTVTSDMRRAVRAAAVIEFADERGEKYTFEVPYRRGIFPKYTVGESEAVFYLAGQPATAKIGHGFATWLALGMSFLLALLFLFFAGFITFAQRLLNRVKSETASFEGKL